MPYVEGESLRAVLKREGRLPIPVVVTVMRDVARALAFAHSKGIVHRDIKPDNILLAGGAAAVADFGVAKALAMARADARHPHGTLTRAGTSLGTPAYMAPEQVSGDPATDHRADLYAFGATAYEMVAGHPPFVRASVTETMQAHLIAEPPPIGGSRPGVPWALEQLIARCLAKDAAQRPQLADEILEVLADPAVVSGEVRSSSLDALRRRRRRRWGFAGIVAATALTVLALSLRQDRATTPPASLAASVPVQSDRLAIFPLVGIASDSVEGAVLAQGMTAALTNAFAGLPGVRVVSSTALAEAMRTSVGFAAAARKLGVAHYVEGVVQRVGDRVQVSVRLLDAVDDLTVWATVHDAAVTDLLTAQNELAATVATAFTDDRIDVHKRS
jgi:serine/threonine-protein kinase